MLRNFLFILLFLELAPVRSDAQAIDVYTNRLLFNVFTDAPDTSLTGFLKLYVPVLNNNVKKAPGSWVSYPSIDTQHAHYEMHSFIFQKHPFFSEKFVLGHMDFFCKRYEGSQIMQNVTGIQLWFEFDMQQDAEIAFNKLIEMFAAVSNDRKISSVQGGTKVAFINRNDKTGFNRVKLSMMADNFSTHKFKIAFEAGNEL